MDRAPLAAQARLPLCPKAAMNAIPPTNSPIIAHAPGSATHDVRDVRPQATAGATTLRDPRTEGEIA